MLSQETRIGSVCLKIADLQTQKIFYNDVIGLEILYASNTHALLGVQDQVLVELVGFPDGRIVHGTTGLYHLALRVPTRADLGAWLQHYMQLDAPFWQGASDHGFSEALYLSDPEGNGIEIYADKPKSVWTIGEDGQIVAFVNPLDLPSLLSETGDGKWQGLPKDSDMGHIHLKVSDMESAREFYTDLLGFEVKTKYQDTALFIAAGDYHHHIGLNTWQSKGAPSPPEDALGLAEFTILLVDPISLEDIQHNLRLAEYPFVMDKEKLSVKDPSGNAIRFVIQQ